MKNVKTDLTLQKIEVDIKRSPVISPWPEHLDLQGMDEQEAKEEELASSNPFSFRDIMSVFSFRGEFPDEMDSVSDESFHSAVESEEQMRKLDAELRLDPSSARDDYNIFSHKNRTPVAVSKRGNLEADDSWMHIETQSDFASSTGPLTFSERFKAAWKQFRRLFRIVRKVIIITVLYAFTSFIGVFAVIFDLLRRAFRHVKRRAPRFLRPLTAPQIHSGFWIAYSTVRERVHTVVRTELLREPADLLVTGHSLGGSLATLCAVDLSIHTVARLNKHFLSLRKHQAFMYEAHNHHLKPAQFLINPWHVHVSMYNIGSPRVGNGAFAAFYDRHVPDSFRIVVDGDLITSTPFAYTHIGTEIIIDGLDDSGSIIIDPSFVERQFRVRNKTSLACHGTDSYQAGVQSVLEAATEDLRELLVKTDEQNESVRSLDFNINTLLARYDSYQAVMMSSKVPAAAAVADATITLTEAKDSISEVKIADD